MYRLLPSLVFVSSLILLQSTPAQARLPFNDKESPSQHLLQPESIETESSQRHSRDVSSILGIQRRAINGNVYDLRRNCSSCINPFIGYCQGGKFGACSSGFSNPVSPLPPNR